MLKSLRYQFKVSRLSKRDSSSTWFEGSVDDEDDDDEGFYMVEAQDECADGQKLENECVAWDVPRLLGLEGINSNVTSEHSEVLSVTQIQQLSHSLPARLQVCEWMLAYRTQTHGSSLRTLYRTTKQLDTCMIVLVKDTYGQVFGAVCSAPLRVSSTYYGTGQTFLFSFSPHLQVYKWTGVNYYFIKGSVDSLLFGGGLGRFGLWLHSDLLRGRSQRCETFDNDVLSSEEDFIITELEVWALV
ncbi:TLD domain-containing protein 2-like [Ictalurus punctatus]|uniref:TLD domain-containing protein 2-like n=1 Tax=Ictalurus punctatus TaxID=7998 RepID=A0A979F8K0_ICTPU|nr:TLD domain-containing protein 2-like [Ictalurus punctatus]